MRNLRLNLIYLSFFVQYRYIERKNDNFKSREVKRLKECALALKDSYTLFSDINHYILAMKLYIIYKINGNYMYTLL